MIFQNFSSYVGPKAERFTKPSRTVPDMAISLRELVERSKTGGAVKTFQTSNVSEDSIVPINMERMSSIDKAAFAKDLADFVTTTRGRLQTVRAAMQKQEFDALVSARAAAMIKPVEPSIEVSSKKDSL